MRLISWYNNDHKEAYDNQNYNIDRFCCNEWDSKVKTMNYWITYENNMIIKEHKGILWYRTNEILPYSTC